MTRFVMLTEKENRPEGEGLVNLDAIEMVCPISDDSLFMIRQSPECEWKCIMTTAWCVLARFRSGLISLKRTD